VLLALSVSETCTNRIQLQFSPYFANRPPLIFAVHSDGKYLGVLVYNLTRIESSFFRHENGIAKSFDLCGRKIFLQKLILNRFRILVFEDGLFEPGPGLGEKYFTPSDMEKQVSKLKK